VQAPEAPPFWYGGGSAGVFCADSLNLVTLLFSLYSVVLLYVGLPILMKVPKDRAMGYTAVVIIVAIVIFVIGQAVISG
jgi:hypothetical protein